MGWSISAGTGGQFKLKWGGQFHRIFQVRPRLTDFYEISLTQGEASFAIPFLDEDIPLYVDPFLLYKSPSQQDYSLHLNLISIFDELGFSYARGDEKAIHILMQSSECDEVGLGSSGTKKGKRIGENTAISILNLYKNIPQINQRGIGHLEVIQLLVDNISRDRISDITCTLIKSFLVDYTIQECSRYEIPMARTHVSIFQPRSLTFINEDVTLPINPESGQPMLFVPKRWLRHVPWINFDDFFDSAIFKDSLKPSDRLNDRIAILEYNRHNYGLVENFIRYKEAEARECKNDPLFKQIPVTSAKRKLQTIIKLPTGKTDNADKKYEDSMVQLLSSILYPHLDFAKSQSRIESGSQIRDLIFYNNRSMDFLSEIHTDYECRQIVVELKNVLSIEREHVTQLNRYLADHFGKFGIIFTRNRASKNIRQNIIDLWSGQRKCLLVLDDEDLKVMCDVFETKQRLPIEVIKSKYIEFIRSCPS